MLESKGDFALIAQILDANVNFVKKEIARNDKIQKKKGENGDFSRKSWREQNRGSGICEVPIGAAQAARDAVKSPGERSSIRSEQRLDAQQRVIV